MLADFFAPAPVQVSQTRTQGGKIDERSPVQSKRIELYVQTTHVTLFEEDSVLFLKGFTSVCLHRIRHFV